MAKLPDPSIERIAAVAAEHAEVDRVLWRVHTPTGAFPTRWDQLRRWGPLPTARFDPWPPPGGDRSGDETRGIAYFGFDIPTCLAEVFQVSRHVSTTRNAPQLSAFRPHRPLQLLDLRGGWPLLIGASHALNSGPRNRCRAWARAIRAAHPGSDGFLYTGIAARDCVVAFDPPGDFFPRAPSFTKPLTDPGLASRIADAANQIGYQLD